MRYDPVGTRCLGHQTGTDALMAVLVADHHTANSGTYVCKYISGSDRRSFHAEGRAGDSSGYPAPMRTVADLLVTYADALGIQEVIYDHQRWDAISRTWKDFHGTDPHTSHVHWSQNWEGATTLTETAARAILNGDDMPLTDEDVAKIVKALRPVIRDECDEAIERRLGSGGATADADRENKTVEDVVRQAIRVTEPKD